MTPLVEKYYPILGGFLAGFGWWYFKIPFAADYKELMAACLSLASILTGFLATAKAILISIKNSRVVRELRASGHFELYIGYLVAAIGWLFFFSVLNLVGFFVPRDQVFSLVWISSGVVSGLAFLRVIYVLFLLLK